jgi:DcmR-like sensory protein
MATSDSIDATVFEEDHHVCAFFHNKDEEARALKPFVLEGLAAGENAIHIVDPSLREDYDRRMSGAGVDLDALERSGQLAVMSWPKSPQHRRIDRHEAARMVDQLLRASRESGYRRTRVIGEMDWAVRDGIRDDELIALKAQLHEVYLLHEVWVVCAYDLSHFGSAIVLDVLRTHPAAMIGGVLQHNPFFVPPEEMIEELRGRGGLVA